MPHRIILFAIFALLTLAAPAHAANSPAWTAWLHYGRHMTLIDSDANTLRELDLPFDNNLYYWLLDVSPAGDEIAYWVQSKAGEVSYPSQITVYSLADNVDNREIFTYTLRDNSSVYRIENQKAFDETGNFLAVGDHAGDLGWEIVVLNINTGEITYRITHTDLPNVNGAHTPIVRDYRGNQISFTLHVNDTWTKTQAYTWDTSTGQIVENLAYLNLNSDTFEPTGEVVMQYATDGHFYNDLFVYDPIEQARYPFFVSSTYETDLNFVQNGERILNSVYTADTRLDDWTLIERDGTQVDQNSSSVFSSGLMAVTSLKGVRDGFLYTIGIKQYDELPRYSLPALYQVNTRDDKLDLGHVIWQISMKEFHSYFDSPEQSYFDIAWVHSDAPTGPFKPWAQLADPVYAPTPEPSQATITPTTIPMPSPLFHVGQTVRVQTIDGEILNLRAKPTRKSDIIIYIEDDTQLELLEGPIDAEGFHWWRVHTPDGLEGWVVENDGELQTILPE